MKFGFYVFLQNNSKTKCKKSFCDDIIKVKFKRIIKNNDSTEWAHSRTLYIPRIISSLL